jgi:hypothetical protein
MGDDMSDASNDTANLQAQTVVLENGLIIVMLVENLLKIDIE